MSTIMDVGASKWIVCQLNTTGKKLKIKQKQLIKLLDYNICISMVFNNSKNMAFVKEVTIGDCRLNKDIIPNALFLNKKHCNFLKKLINNKDIVENHSDFGLSSMLGDIKSEVFIPIFKRENINGLTLTLIGCLYLGSVEYKQFPASLLPQHRALSECISDISQLLTLCSMAHERMAGAINAIDVFMNILEKKDPYLSNHSYNVANWCREIGTRLGYSRVELHKLIFAGLLHDVGKAMIDDSILKKKTELTERESLIIKKHPIDSFKVAKSIFNCINELEDIPDLVQYHHERYDGEGYPYGLKGEQVPLGSYIIGISDAVDAMMSNRPYKKAKPLNATIRELYRNKGKQFHPKLVDVMVEELTRAQKQLEQNIFHGIGLSTLIIRFVETIKIIEGTLLQVNHYFMFRPNDIDYIKKIDISKIVNVEMVIKDLNNLDYYEIKLEDFAENVFYISSLKLIPAVNTFNLLWDLEGMLYLPDGIEEISVEITRIGGDRLSLCLHKDQALGIPYMMPLKIKVFFEEQEIDITGNIVKGYNFGPYRHLDFHYTNIPDSTRDSIYRQLFKKQIKLRQAISEYKV